MRLRRGLKCVRENGNFGGAVEQSSSLLAAKRRKNAAHGASRGKKGEADKAPAGRKTGSHAHTEAAHFQSWRNTRLPVPKACPAAFSRQKEKSDYAEAAGLRCWKHSRQNTGRPCVGRKGTVVSLPQPEQIARVSTLL